MNNYKILPILLICLAFAGPEAAGQPSSPSQEKEVKNLVLTHPTVSNLEVMINLMEKDMIGLDHWQLIGVYHKHERYDYARSRQYLDTLQYEGPRITLRQFSDTIHDGVLYRKNALSDDYTRIFELSEGVVFFGGPDMPPWVYGEKTSLHTSIYDPFRHYFELSFLYHLLGGFQNARSEPLLEENPDYLIYGFCLGMQTMNVATGGKLIQDIPTEVYDLEYAEDIVKLDRDRIHRNYNRSISVDKDLISGYFHRVLFKTSDYARRLELEDHHPVVYSNHHQAVDRIGKGFEVMATSMDGKIVEGLEHEQYPNVIGVQFHPEARFLYGDQRTYRLEPGESPTFTGMEMLRKSQSLGFHRDFWADFEMRLRGE